MTYFKDVGILSGPAGQMTVTVIWGAMLAGRLCIAFVFPVKNSFRTLSLMSACCVGTYILLLMAKTPASALICLFLLVNGVPAMAKIGLPEFLFGMTWRPANDLFGIFPMIVGSLYVTAGAIVVGVPGGLLTAVYLSRFARGRVGSFLRSGVELLAGIPSVVYGFFGLVIIVPFVRLLGPGTGLSVLAASLILGIMILPTIITVAQSALDAVPARYYEGALALGVDHEHAVFKVVVPAAASGIMAAIVLGLGRAIGETMAVVMVAGNMPIIPDSLLSGVRTMTANIVLEMGYAADLHREALIATGVVLFVFVLLTTMLLSVIRKRGEAR